jgi:hypothetical protein
MSIKLAEAEVKRWLRGQRMGAKKVEEERIHFLLHLTPEESLRIFLSLLPGTARDGRNLTKPSPILWAMRQALRRHDRLKKRQG